MADAPHFTAEQLLGDLAGMTLDGRVFDEMFFTTDLGACALVSIDNVTQQDDETNPGSVQVLCDAAFENAAYRVLARLDLTYSLTGGGSWVCAEVSAEEVGRQAIAPIEYDPVGRFDAASASIELDEEAQVCRVRNAYEPLWFETVSGDPALLYRFDGSSWVFQGLDPASATVTYEGLAGQYDDPSNPGFEPTTQEDGSPICRLVIDAVDAQGTASGSIVFEGLRYRQSEQVAAALAGQAVGAMTPSGDHRATLVMAGTLEPDGTPVAVTVVADSETSDPSSPYGGLGVQVSFKLVAMMDELAPDGSASFVSLPNNITEASMALEQIQAAAVPMA